MAISLVANSSLSEVAVINGGNGTVPISSNVLAGDYIVVAVGIGSSRATPTLQVTSSSTSTAYTLISTRVDSSSMHFGVFGRLLPATELSAIVTGTGNSSDSIASVAMAFRGVDPVNPLDATPTTSSGAGTTPDSPSITVATSNAVIISAVNAQVTDTTVTAPSSFLDQININANDNWDATCGMAWVTNTSTSALDPASWTNFTTSTWGSATIALRQFVPSFTWSMSVPLSEPDLGRTEIVGY